MIEFRAVAKRFGDTEAVSGLDLVIPARRTTVILASSGSGQTSTVRMICRLAGPASGTGERRGGAVRDRAPGGPRRGTSYGMQSAGRPPPRRGLDNVTTVFRLTK